MERVLTNYIRALRSAGAGVSTTEALDAARTVELVGYGDRALLKAALAPVLTKSVEETEIHNRLFDLFFARAEAASMPAPTAQSESGDGEGSAPAESPSLTDLAQSGDAGQIAMAMEKAGAAVGVDQIRFASQVGYFTRRMLEELGVDKLEAKLLEKLQARTPEAEAEAQGLMQARSEVQKQARAYVQSRFEVFGRSATEAFMNEVMVERSIGEIGRGDMDRMKLIVAKMAKRLAVRHSRRRKVRNRGQLDIRKTMRANAGYDSVPFEVVWKTKHRDKPRIVVICDVSGSVARYVRFLLLLIYSLSSQVTDIETFAFSNELNDVSHHLERLDFETAMNRILDEFGDGSTDYGQAFMDLRERHWDVIDRRTTVLILGDGRSNYGEPKVEILAELADQAKRVVWLCPEAEGSWGVGDSCMLDYRPHCTQMVHCSTVGELEHALDEVLMAYD